MAQTNKTSASFTVVLPTLAALLFLAALIALLTALALLFPSPIWLPMWDLNPEAYQTFHRMGRTAEVLLAVLAGLSAVTGVGLMRRKRWAWRLALLGMTANGAGDLVSLLVTRQFLRFGSGTLIAAAFLLLLALPPVRRSLS